MDIEDLPVIDMSRIEFLEEVLRAPSLMEGMKNIPNMLIPGEGGRWNTFAHFTTKFIHEGVDDASIVRTLIGLDRRLFPGNQYFLSEEKLGKKGIVADKNSSNADEENCTLWVAEYKANILRKDPTARRAMMNANVYSEEVRSTKDWLPIVPLMAERHEVEFPKEIMPDSFGRYIEDLKKLSSMPTESYFMPLLTTFSVACQGSIVLRPKADFINFPSISSLIIAPSGSRKDAAISAAKSPLMKLVNGDMEKIDQNFIEKEKQIIYQLENVDKKKKKALTEYDEELVKQLTKEGFDLQAQLTSLKKQKPTFIFESGSQEKLMLTMHDNQHRGLFICVPEFIQFIGTANRAGNESLRGYLLKVLNGSFMEGHIHQTMHGLSINTKHVYGAALMGVQTDIFENEINKMKMGRDNDGLLQRFCLVPVLPDIVRMNLDIKEVRSFEVDNKFALMYNNTERIFVGFEDSIAANRYIDYDYNVTKMARSEENSSLGSFKSKFSGNVLKVAYLLMQADSPKGIIAKNITTEYMDKAIKTCDWLQSNADKAYEKIKSSSSIAIANEIISSETKSGALNDGLPYQSLQKKLNNQSHTKFSDAITVLERGNHIKIINKKVYWNPYYANKT
jgi:hypothetical protein